MVFWSLNLATPEPALSAGWLRMRRGAYRWELIEPIAGWLDEDGELPISDWLALGLAKIIKTGPHRTVYRLMMSQGTFYLKHYRTPGWQAVLQNLVRPSKAELEQRAALRVRELGLNTIETVAVGRRRDLGVVTDNFLISRAIENVLPLDAFVIETFPTLNFKEQTKARRQIARQLGTLAAVLHRGGVLHRDLHPGNILIQRRGESLELFLIDLHALSQKRNLSETARALNLALVNNFFARRSSITDRCRFLNAYFEVWNQDHSEKEQLPRDAVRFVDRICQTELKTADARGDKKWRRGNRRLIILETPPNRCRGLSGFGRIILHSLKENPEQLFEDRPVFAWQKSAEGNQQAVIELPYQGQSQRAMLTRFRLPDQARQAWEMGHALLRRRLPTPLPLLFVETPAGQWDYFITEEIAGAVSLKRRAWEQAQNLSQTEFDRWLRDVTLALAKALQSLHEHGFHQGELTLSSWIIATEGPLRLWFVPLENLRQHSRITSEQIQRSFAKLAKSLPSELYISQSGRLRFLRSYLGPRFRAEWKSYWRSVSLLLMDVPGQEAA